MDNQIIYSELAEPWGNIKLQRLGIVTPNSNNSWWYIILCNNLNIESGQIMVSHEDLPAVVKRFRGRPVAKETHGKLHIAYKPRTNVLIDTAGNLRYWTEITGKPQVKPSRESINHFHGYTSGSGGHRLAQSPPPPR